MIDHRLENIYWMTRYMERALFSLNIGKSYLGYGLEASQEKWNYCWQRIKKGMRKLNEANPTFFLNKDNPSFEEWEAFLNSLFLLDLFPSDRRRKARLQNFQFFQCIHLFLTMPRVHPLRKGSIPAEQTRAFFQ